MAWTGQKGRQNQLIKASFLCDGGSSSSVFCGCVVAIIQYTRCRVYTATTTPKPSEIPPPQHLAGCDHPRNQAHVKHHLKETAFCICSDPGEEAITAINYGEKE